MANAILEKIKNVDNLEEMLTSESDSELLLQLSHMRRNLIEWIPLPSDGTVLEIGAGCGVITGLLAERGMRVMAVEKNPDFMETNRYINRNFHNISYKTDLKKLEGKYDFAVITELKDICRDYNVNAEALLQMVSECLNQNGQVFLAMENKYALSSWAGMEQDKLQQGYTLNRIKTILADTGFDFVSCYYPTPDYRIPMEIFSEKYPIKAGTITENSRNYENTRYQALDEAAIAAELCKDDMYEQFANAYLLVAGKADANTESDSIIYAKYNSTRDPQFQLRTRILENQDKRWVEKRAMTEQAQAHLKQMEENQRLLQAVYRNVKPVECKPGGNALQFTFIKGNGIFDISSCTASLDGMVSLDGMISEIKKVFAIIFDFEKEFCIPFSMTDAFLKMFPECTPKEGMPAYAISNLDSIVSNFVKTESGDVYCLDYEWVANFPVPVNYVKYRSLIYIYKEMQSMLSSLFGRDELLHFFEMKNEEIALYDKMEIAFQQYVHGKNLKYNYLKRYEKPTVTLQDLIAGGATERIEGYEKQLKDKDTHIFNMEQIGAQKDEMIASQTRKIQLLETDVQEMQRNLQEKADLLGKLEYERKHPLKVLYGKIAGRFFKYQPLDASRLENKGQMVEVESGFSEQLSVPDAISADFDSHLNVDQLSADAEFVFSGWTWDAFYKNNNEAQRLVLLERVENGAVVETRAYRTFTIHRPDVAEGFPERNDLDNVGFLCRVKKDELVSGIYDVSILTREKGAKRYKKHRVAWQIDL